MADHKDGDPMPFRQLHQGHGAVLHLAHAARRGGQIPVVEGLDGVHDQDIGLELIHRLQNILQAGLRQQIHPLAPDVEPLGPQLDLPLRLLTGHIEHLGEPTQVVADLEHQGGLADARRAAHQHQGALYRSPAQHPIQLAHAGGEAELLSGLYLPHGPRTSPAGPQTSAGGRRRRALFLRLGRPLHQGIPRLAGGALPRPLGRLIAAFGAVKQGFCFHLGRFSPLWYGQASAGLPSPASHWSQEAVRAEASLLW